MKTKGIIISKNELEIQRDDELEWCSYVILKDPLLNMKVNYITYILTNGGDMYEFLLGICTNVGLEKNFGTSVISNVSKYFNKTPFCDHQVP